MEKQKISDVEMDDLVDTKVCVKYGGEKPGEQLEVGALFKEIVSEYTHYKI